jgi:hypothetical protein
LELEVVMVDLLRFGHRTVYSADAFGDHGQCFGLVGTPKRTLIAGCGGSQIAGVVGPTSTICDWRIREWQVDGCYQSSIRHQLKTAATRATRAAAAQVSDICSLPVMERN